MTLIGFSDHLLVNASEFVKSFNISSRVSFYKPYGSSLYKWYYVSFLCFLLFVRDYSNCRLSYRWFLNLCDFFKAFLSAVYIFLLF